MRHLIERLYPDAVDEVMAGISALKNSYDGHQNERPLDHTDSILITYGDSFIRAGQAPLVTLREVADAYLQPLSAIHLLPCFPYSSDDGFSVIDYYQINPELGDWGHIEDLAKDRDLMFDAVVNHMSKESKWFQGFLNGDPRFSDYFIEADPSMDYSAVVRPRALPLLHVFEKEGTPVSVWTTFSEDQVDLNYRSPKVFLQVLDILLYYASKGARYVRLDAIAFLWKELGTPCIHLDQTHQVIQVYRKVIEDMGKQIVLITETNVPHEENISYFGNGTNEAHMVYNFTLPPLLAHSLRTQDVAELTDWAGTLELQGGTCFFNFTASHDGVGVRPLQGIIATDQIEALADTAIAHGGFVSYKDNGDGTKSPYELNCNYMDLLTHPERPDAERIDRFLLTQSVLLCMPGVPGIYYHSIFGSENDRAAALSSGINRRINRSKLDAGELHAALSNPDSFRAKVYRAYMALLEVRTSEPLFNPYGQAGYKRIGSVFVITRKQQSESFFGLHNFSDAAVDLKAFAPDAVDLLTGKKMDEATWQLPPFGILWIKTKG